MHCHLLVPGLLWPEIAADTPRLDALELLLARGRRSIHEDETPQAWLSAAFGVDRQQDWPAAPYSLLADGGKPENGYWLRADPVHLRIQRDHLLLADATQFSLSREEATQLADSLNRHFAADGLTLHPLLPGRWYARLGATPALTTVPLEKAAGGSVDANLPGGGDAPIWHARLNEIQMLLHDHPVNEAREARGELPVNSLWFWGGGTLSATPGPSPFECVLADDPFARGLALAAGKTAQLLPESAAAWLAAAPREGVTLIVLGQLAGALAYGDLGAWRERLTDIEQRWFAPLLAALRERRIGMLTLHAFGLHSGPRRGIAAEASRQDLARFWRRAKPLAYYAAA